MPPRQTRPEVIFDRGELEEAHGAGERLIPRATRIAHFPLGLPGLAQRDFLVPCAAAPGGRGGGACGPGGLGRSRERRGSRGAPREGRTRAAREAAMGRGEGRGGLGRSGDVAHSRGGRAGARWARGRAVDPRNAPGRENREWGRGLREQHISTSGYGNGTFAIFTEGVGRAKYGRARIGRWVRRVV
ncbi:hypothetical protein T492DRAFT_833575 [Pavlovales sp. CCMP2436]|nr:hypothetical protein T492DRAFT_833575 [Pavlovales sp. CCMP2436]